MGTPQLQLETLFVLDRDRRIAALREPGPGRAPRFALVRGTTSCAWAVRADLPRRIADELDAVARDEPPAPDLRVPPLHADRYRSIAGGRTEDAGPAFTFPEGLAPSPGVVLVEDERLLERHFRGWVPGEIAGGRAPVVAVVGDDDGHPISVCFCARRSEIAAEAGLETAAPFRRRGLGATVTAAWAAAIRATRRVPLYSTSWSNHASLAVARRLGLTAYASDWSISD